MNTAIYTCITGDYDRLYQPRVTRKGYDFICFTDNIELLSGGQVGVWEIRPIPKFTFTAGTMRKISKRDRMTLTSRYVKLMPHEALPEYDWSLWMDANLEITGNGLYDAVEAMISQDCTMAQVPHPDRDCVWDEMYQCLKTGRIGFCETVRLKRNFRKEAFPRHWGIFENNLILRRHSGSAVREVCTRWWKEYGRLTFRDQLSLMPILRRLGLRPALLFGEGVNTRNSSCVEYHPHSAGAISSKRTGLNKLTAYLYKVWRQVLVVVAKVAW